MKTLFAPKKKDGADNAGGDPSSKSATPVALVKVKVLSGAVSEDDATYLKGDTFETTAERAAALGDSVQLASPPTL